MANSEYPYQDCFGTSFRVAKNLSGLNDHTWDVYEQKVDEGGNYEEYVDDVDDCDSEQAAVEAWLNRQKSTKVAWESHAGEVMSDVLLNLLERLLSISEPFLPLMSPEDVKDWQEISAATADMREGEDV